MLVLTVLTIIVVAFMQSMTVERQTARSYLNRSKAQLAAQAGLNTAIAQIQTTLPKTSDEVNKGFITWTWAKDATFNTTYTGLLTDIFNAPAPNLGIDRTVWLFSCRTNPADPDKLSSDVKDQYNVNLANRVNLSTTPINVDWLEMPDQSSTRYAYWVSDESGKFDITRVGNSGNATKDSGYLTDLALPVVPTGEINKLLTKNSLLRDLSALTPLQVAPSLANSPTSFGVSNNNWNQVINYGPMGLQPRTNINALYTNSGGDRTKFVTDFDTFISTALPDYYARKNDPTWPGEMRSVAASIYDYIDPSSTITFSPNLKTFFKNALTTTSTWPKTNNVNTYYGVKAVPRINEYLVYYGTASSSGRYSSTSIDITRTIELWNMSQKPVTLTSVTVRLFNQQRGGAAAPPLDETISDWTQTPDGTIPPNGFVVLKSTKSYAASLPGSFETFRTSLNNSNTGIILIASVNGDPPGVVDGYSPMLLQASAAAGKAGVSPGYSGSGDTTDTRASLGLYLSKWSPVTGTAHSPGQPNNSASGRTYQNMKNWFDQPQVGGLQSVSPTSSASYIRGGKMAYIGELGNIWDPNKDMVDTTNLPRGGKTLVIGQFDPYYRLQSGALKSDADHNTYQAYLKRADAALLDVLTVNDDARININSPRPTSEPSRPLAVFGSALNYSTSDIFPQSAKPSYDYQGLENAIINRLATPSWKDARPFRNTNDLMTLDPDSSKLTATPYVEGPTNFWTAQSSKLWKNAAPSTVSVVTTQGALANQTISILNGDDRSREEGFRRISNWLSFASLTYRVYAAGQVLDPQGKPLSRATIEAIVTFAPVVVQNANKTTSSVTYVPKIQIVRTE
jgi:hypothetical protein